MSPGELFVRTALSRERLRIASSFFCDPEVETRLLPARELAGHNRHCMHTIREMMLVISGSAEIVIEDKLYSGGAGTLFVIGKSEMHESGYTAGAPDGLHLWMSFDADIFVCHPVEVSGGSWGRIPAMRGFRHTDPQSVSRMMAVLDAIENGGEIPLLLAEFQALVRMQLTGFVRMMDRKEDDSVPAVADMQDRIINIAAAHIRRNHGRDCSVETLAQLCGYSRTHFMRLFRNVTGCTVMEAVNRSRSEYCRKIPRGTPLKVVADELGFGSASAYLHWLDRHPDAAAVPPADKKD